MLMSDWSSDVCSSDLSRWSAPGRATTATASPAGSGAERRRRLLWERLQPLAFRSAKVGTGRCCHSERSDESAVRAKELAAEAAPTRFPGCVASAAQRRRIPARARCEAVAVFRLQRLQPRQHRVHPGFADVLDRAAAERGEA